MNSEQKIELAWDFMIENYIASQSELELATNLIGYSMETMNRIIYARTGYHNIKQLHDCQEDFYFYEEIIENIEEFE